MYNCTIYIVVGFLTVILFYYYIRYINRDTFEKETDETLKIGNEFVDNINNLQPDILNKYLGDLRLDKRIDDIEKLQLENRIKEIENQLNSIKSQNLDNANKIKKKKKKGPEEIEELVNDDVKDEL
jgi:hypothetical protein